jgi:hypothetical protein
MTRYFSLDGVIEYDIIPLKIRIENVKKIGKL